MKNKIIFLFAILFAAGLNSSRAQDTWTQKADFGGTGRSGAVGFSIGSKGYLGTGTAENDFWEYNTTTNAWTQKANFGGAARGSAVGFSIDGKGYIGTGNFTNDFWEYDPAANAWTQKANFGGTARTGAVGFSIGSKGYIGTGFDGIYNPNSYKKDFWEYDPATNSWTQKADFAGSGRAYAVGFSIGSEGYIGTGFSFPGNYEHYYKDFWKYDPAANSWTKKANFGGTARIGAVGFSIGSKGYLGTGSMDTYTYPYTKNFWEYDTDADTWTQKADLGDSARAFATGFSIGSKGYIGTGFTFSGYGLHIYSDFWEYVPNSSTCVVPTNLSVTNITSSSAKLNWDAVADAQRYKVRYKITGSGTWIRITNISSNSKKVSGLATSTSYTCEVKSVCSANPIASSGWSSSQTFTTGSSRTGDESLQQVSFQIYPNPAEDHATIQFTLPQSFHVCIKVYDVSGKEIATLLDDEWLQGMHSLQLNNHQLSKGVYMVKMISDFGIENQKLIVQ